MLRCYKKQAEGFQMIVYARRSSCLIGQMIRRDEEQNRLGKRGFGLALVVLGVGGVALSHTMLGNYLLAAVYWIAFCFALYFFCRCWCELRALDPWRIIEKHKRPAE